MAARVPVPKGSAVSPTRIWFSVVATSGRTASGVQVVPTGNGAPSGPASGAPSRSRISVSGVGSHFVPEAASVA